MASSGAVIRPARTRGSWRPEEQELGHRRDLRRRRTTARTSRTGAWRGGGRVDHVASIPPAIVFVLMQKPFMSGFAVGQDK